MSFSVLIHDFVRFIQSSTFVNYIIFGRMDVITKVISQVEKVIVMAFARHPNLAPKTSRSSSLHVMLLSDIYRLSGNRLADRISNIQVFLNDILKYHLLLESSFTYVSGAYEIYKRTDLDYYFWRNVSTGLSMGYRQLKPMFANNHILSKLMDDPSQFLGRTEDMLTALGVVLPTAKTLEVGLENGSRYLEKIDDATVALEVPQFSVPFGNNVLDLGSRFIRTTYDSKFYINPNRIIETRTIQQQIMLTFQDRVADDFVPILRRIIDSDLTDAEQVEAVEKLLPVLFQHYVVKPADTPTVDVSVNDAYADAFAIEADFHFEAIINTLIPGFDVDHEHLAVAVTRAIGIHADNHFRTGAFILETSDIRYFDW